MIVIELFAGVGGFRLGLEGLKNESGQFYSATSQYKEVIKKQEFFVTGYSNQWEPNEKKQFASRVYVNRFGKSGHSNSSIEDVTGRDITNTIAETIHTNRLSESIILVGGFPCQDYSVANGLHNSKGIIGKKGVLWWHIERILRELKELNRQPEVVLLENVDRLLKSPASARGRDFAIMMTCLEALGYDVEYRVINASDYGFPQKRKRVFILATKRISKLNEKKILTNSEIIYEYNNSLINKAFAAKIKTLKDIFHLNLPDYSSFSLKEELIKIQSRRFEGKSPFGNAGFMKSGVIYPMDVLPEFESQQKSTLRKILQDDSEVQKDFYISPEEIVKWESVKGAKKIKRVNPLGVEYWYSEGKMSLTDDLDRPSRTIITSEGGRSAMRTKHLIQSSNGLRRLTSVELERLNMFPDNHTYLDDITSVRRAFLMGNALVIGVVERIRNSIISKYV